jgi:hypothetical protein
MGSPLCGCAGAPVLRVSSRGYPFLHPTPQRGRARSRAWRTCDISSVEFSASGRQPEPFHSQNECLELMRRCEKGEGSISSQAGVDGT